ncbi:TPR repeat-containing thioredoxin TTL1-like [Silene latifolia]|uniref:TPR repeat-containing thioredoxin TTL1-like n=1 Tax=Silene latifolia TaxID=37657 RepID=UPI003D76C75C
MGTILFEPDHGCGFIGGIIRRRKFRPRKASLPSTNTHNKNPTQKVTEKPVQNSDVVNPRTSVSKPSLDSTKSSAQKVSKQEQGNFETKVHNSTVISPRISVSNTARNSNVTTITRTKSSSSSSSSSNLALVKVNKIDQTENGNKLSKIRTDHSQNPAILRVSSGNILKLPQIKGLKNHGNENSPRKSLSSPKMSTKNLECKGTMGNILRRNSEETRVHPEELKSMGNDVYKQGRYEEALMLYNQAIALDSNMAAYWSNKSAALTALGRLLEAVVACKEAVKIDPLYPRAQHRLATLYFRLGYPEEALNHFSLSGSTANFVENNQAKALESCLSKCTIAKQHKDWTALVKQTQNAFALGSDSALQVYALQAQALLNLHRHDEAYAVLKRKPEFDMDSYTRIFGHERSTYVYLIDAQVYTAVGRFEDGITAAQNGLQVNPGDKDLRTILITAQSMSSARSKGNRLFKEQKFLEACNVYSEGLEYNQYNSVLLCNRAASRSKLGQFEKALEDCTLALSLQPSYSKARLRRAHCNGQLGRWEASVQDYEILIREKPGDEEVGRALFEAKIQLKKQCGEDVKDMKFEPEVILVSSIECFRHLITSPGMSVVLFCNKSNQEMSVPLLEQVCPRFPSINFLKVEVEDHPYLTKSEEVNYIPAFKIYKNGSRVRDIPGNNLKLLETSVKLYSS